MFNKINALLVVVCVSLPSLILGANLIELNDANQAILQLELSKNVKFVQQAVERGFKFDSVAEASKFLLNCHVLKDKMSTAQDSDFNGMSATIKSLLAEQSLLDACSVDYENFDEKYNILSTFSAANLDYLSKSKFDQLVGIKQEIDSNSGLKVLLANLFSKKIDELSKGLLESGAVDVDYLFAEKQAQEGFFDLDVKFKSGCSLAHLMPICKFVRRTHFDNVSATGDDVSDAITLIESNDQEKIKFHEGKSKVDFETVKDECSYVIDKDFLSPIAQLERYKAAGFLNDEQISEHFNVDPKLHLYKEIYGFCMKVSS